MALITRQRTWAILDTQHVDDAISQRVHAGILTLIILNVAAVVLQSVAAIETRCARFFDLFELVSVAVFTIEYLARVWSCTEHPAYAHPLWGRLRFMLSPMALVDLLAVLPFYMVFIDLDLRFVRALRLVRLARAAKLGRYSEASSLLMRVLRNKREEMLLTTSLLVTLTIIFASLMYYAESAAQPDKFPDIPHAMWWAVITITTVGYGDVFPITPWGKVIASFTALLGILMIALPTGVFGAAFVEELGRRKAAEARKCPHCGKEIP